MIKSMTDAQLAKITKLAAWWIRRRGGVVLSPGFVGMALGHCIALRSIEDRRVFRVTMPIENLHLLNGTIVMDGDV